MRVTVCTGHAVTFSEFTDGIDNQGAGVIFSHGDSGITCNYAIADAVFSTGRHSWDVTVLADDGDDGQYMAFGLSRSGPSANFRNSGEMWMYEGNGDLHMQGSPQRRLLPQLEVDDVVHCLLDMDEGTLSFMVNGVVLEVCGLRCMAGTARGVLESLI